MATGAAIECELRTFWPGIWFVGAMAWLLGRRALPVARHVPLGRIKMAGKTEWLTIAKGESC